MSREAQDRVLILGAAGRDFHDFNVYWKNRAGTRVVAFTATQIPDIQGRTYPAVLAGTDYPAGIPIHDQGDLERLIREQRVTHAALAYSDLSYDTVMHLAAQVNAAGAAFVILGPAQTMLESRRPVVAVCAVRTGCGKSQTSRRVSRILKELGKKVAVVRHPMPYGDLTRQVCQRFSEVADLRRHECTIEECEEYEPHINAGNVVFAGFDYAEILRQAEAEADVILWDGGNNDTPFFKPALHIVVTDPHRQGHETRYYPGETNLRLADVVIINKADTASEAALSAVERSAGQVNPRALIVKADSPVSVDDERAIAGKRVLVVEDGPTLTHGEMSFGAAHVAARRYGAAEIVDPRPHANGSIREVFRKYTQLSDVLPAMGYGSRQIAELEATINAVPCDVVLIGTPIDLGRLLHINKPAVRVRYELREHDPALLPAAIAAAI
jgi:predicted GTPase